MKDDCAGFRDLLMENGVLPQSEWPAELREHLAECASCAALGEELRALARCLASVPEIRLPQALTAEALRRALADERVRWIDPEYPVGLVEQRGLRGAPFGAAPYERAERARALMRRLPAPL